MPRHGGAASVLCVLFVVFLVYAYMCMSTHITYIDYYYYYYYYCYYYYICMYITHRNTVLLTMICKNCNSNNYIIL